MAVDADKSLFLILATNGSGITTALDIFSDFGFVAVGGVDPQQLHNTVLPLTQGQAPAAFALRLTAESDPAAILADIRNLKQTLPHLKTLTLDAPEEVLVQRYMHSEKQHPFEAWTSGGLKEAVAAEKKLFAPLKETKDYSIDTSTTTAIELRHKIGRVLGFPIDNQELTVNITTFGYKYGMPQDAELVFDMRFLTNPFYDENLRPMTGQDKPVRDFIFNLPQARRFFDKWADLVCDLLPLYQDQGKTRLTIAVGCTGGKHRSVCMGEALAQHIHQHCPRYKVVITHREMLKWGKTSATASQADACTVGDAPPAC